MPSSRKTAELVGLFERVGVLYIGRMMGPTWDQTSPSGTPNARQALALFVGSYAFEYQGAAPNFGPAAYRAIRSQKGSLDPASVWREFCSRIDGGANPRHNVLYHQPRSCTCVLCSVCEDGRPRNLVTQTRDRLLTDEAARCFKELTAIRGIGPKLASFFLRDVALRFDVMPTSDRDLLQPVDLWIRRFVRRLDSNGSLGDSSVARWIVDHADRPERVNAGMWYFGAQIAPQRLIYDDAFANPGYADELVEQHVARLAGAVAMWNKTPPAGTGGRRKPALALDGGPR